MAIRVNLSQVKALEPVSVGWYPCTVERATEGVSQNGNPKIDLQWKIDEGPNAGRIIFDTLTFTENAMPIVKMKLVNMGFDADYEDELSAEDFIGLSAELYVTIEASRGSDADGNPYPDRNRVSKMRPQSHQPELFKD